MDNCTNTKEKKWHVHVIHVDQYHQYLLKTLTFLLFKNSSNKHPSSLKIHLSKKKTKIVPVTMVTTKKHHNMYTTPPLV